MPSLTSRQQSELDIIVAPWGRHEDGTPRKQSEYNRLVAQASVEAYGSDYYDDIGADAAARNHQERQMVQRNMAEKQRDRVLKKLGLADTPASRAQWLSLLDSDQCHLDTHAACHVTHDDEDDDAHDPPEVIIIPATKDST